MLTRYIRLVIIAFLAPFTLLPLQGTDTIGRYAPHSAALTPAAKAGAALSGDIERGRVLFNQCSSCHALTADKAVSASGNTVQADNDQGFSGKKEKGPHLEGLFGRIAGSVQTFSYSAALSQADFRWDEEKLDLWLSRPNSFLPGNRMAFAGVRSAKDRDDLITYLKTATHRDKNQPE